MDNSNLCFSFNFKEQFVSKDYILVLKDSKMGIYWQERYSACQIAMQSLFSVPLPAKL